VICYRRKGNNPEEDLLIILNMTPEVRRDWKVVTHGKKEWKEVFNSNDSRYWGTGDVFNPTITVHAQEKNNDMYEINVHLPSLGAVVLR
jgi:1,4-alpha-glucan branching enzyme